MKPNEFLMKKDQVSLPEEEQILASDHAGFIAARGAILRVLAHGFGVVVSIIATRLLLHYLAVVDTADYGIVIALLAIVSGIAEAGMTAIGVQEYVKRKGDNRAFFFRNLLGLRMVCVFIGVSFATAFALWKGYSSVMVWGLIVGGIGNIIVLFAATLTIPLQASLQFGWVALLDFSRQFVLALLLIVVVLFKGSLLFLLAVPLPAGVLLLSITFFVVRKPKLWIPAFSRTQWKELIRIAGLFSLVAAIGTVYFFITQVLLSFVSTKFETGLYSASFRVFITLIAVPGLLVTSFFPILTHANETGDLKRFQVAVTQLLQVCLLLAGFTTFSIISLAPFIMNVLAGHDYISAVDVLRVHGGALAITFFVVCGSFSLLALGRLRSMLLISGLGLVVNVVAVLLLARFDGARGAAFGDLLGEVTLALGSWILLYRLEIRWNVRDAGKFLLPSVLASSVLLLEVHPVVMFLLGTFIFVVTIFLVKSVFKSLTDAVFKPVIKS